MEINGHQRSDVESQVLAGVLVRGVPAILEAGDMGRSLLRGERRHAFEAARELAMAGQIGPAGVPLDLIEDAVRVHADASHAATVRLACQVALDAHGRDMSKLGRVEVAVGYLLDLETQAKDGTGKDGGAGGTKFLSGADIFEPLPPVPWLCQPLDLAPGAPFLVSGFGFCGKTLTLQDLALAVATGTLAWGRFPVRQGRVLHLDYEQGAYLTRSRYQRLAAARGIDPREIEGRLVVAPMPSWYLDGDTADVLGRLADDYDLVLIDSFRAACPTTDENSSEARVHLDRLTRISDATGTTFGVIHHSRKPSQNATGGARMSIRGSGALYDACGSVFVFAAEKGEPITVEHEKARISGRPHDTFQLVIEDVEGPGGPRDGLRVSALNSTPPDRLSAPQRLQALQDRILAAIEANGSTGGVNVLSRQLEARRADVGAAVEELLRTRRIENAGTKQSPSFRLAGTTPSHD